MNRSINEVTLPLDWLPPGDDPRLSVVPWLYTKERKALVEQVTNSWLESKQLSVRDLNAAIAVDSDGDGDSDVVSVDSGAIDGDGDLGEMAGTAWRASDEVIN